jgi:hypothetical protein
MDNFQEILERRLENAKEIARQFADAGLANSAEMWAHTAGVLEAILDEAKGY